MTGIRAILTTLQAIGLHLSLFLICAAAVACVLATGLAAVGVLPWMQIEIGFGDKVYPQAGVAVQVGVTLMSLMLAFYLPANGRILALERAHRDFNLHMDDIARAYQLAHAADREGRFQIASEFDAVKDRLMFLKDHPDLGRLEPEVLEIAARMSQVSQELAETYSDEKVARARTFLTQRQQEIDQFNQRLEDAKIVMHELRQWSRDVEIDESVARSQLRRLREELFELLPELSAQLQETPLEETPHGDSVVPLSKKPRKSSEQGPSDPTKTL